MRLLVIGATGMVGHSIFTYLSHFHEVQGTTRKEVDFNGIETGYDVFDPQKFLSLIKEGNFDVVINCVGVIKHIANSSNESELVYVNSYWPYKLLEICKSAGTKLLQFSTDCVFNGETGDYSESSLSDARDLYGKSKYLGEISDDPSCLTLRTSTLGHELYSNIQLMDWFLSQQGQVSGYSKAIFTGFPTNSIARIINDYVLEKFVNKNVYGLYNMSSDPISKYDLLRLVGEVYKKDIKINANDDVKIDRSLNSTKFRKEFNYSPRAWPELVKELHEYYLELKNKGLK